MNIYFECVGFRTSSVFIQFGEDEIPQPVGFVHALHDEKSAKFCIDLGLTLEQEQFVSASVPLILTTYVEKFEEHGAAINNISKKAWLENRFGEPIKS